MVSGLHPKPVFSTDLRISLCSEDMATDRTGEVDLHRTGADPYTVEEPPPKRMSRFRHDDLVMLSIAAPTTFNVISHRR